MKTYAAVVELCPDTGLYVGYVPGFRRMANRDWKLSLSARKL